MDRPRMTEYEAEEEAIRRFIDYYPDLYKVHRQKMFEQYSYTDHEHEINALLFVEHPSLMEELVEEVRNEG